MNRYISAVILSKNEESRIGKCLQSLSWANERVVIDNGSIDETVKEARKHNVRVIENLSDNFSVLRTAGKDIAKNEWILYVDADEQVTPELHEKIESIIKEFDPEVGPVAFFIKRKNYYLGHEWPTRDKMQRFFWKQSLRGWRGELHETAIIEGKVGEIEEPLLHDTHRTLEEMIKKTNVWSETEAKLRLKADHPPVVGWRLLRVMVTSFLDSFITQEGWRAGTVGWIESIYQSFSMFITYAKLWELQQKKKS